jgi:hypothetical protein
MPSTWPSYERLGRTQYQIVMSLRPAILTAIFGLTFHGFALICQYLSSTVQVLIPSICSHRGGRFVERTILQREMASKDNSLA